MKYFSFCLLKTFFYLLKHNKKCFKPPVVVPPFTLWIEISINVFCLLLWFFLEREWMKSLCGEETEQRINCASLSLSFCPFPSLLSHSAFQVHLTVIVKCRNIYYIHVLCILSINNSQTLVPEHCVLFIIYCTNIKCQGLWMILALNIK